MKKSLRMWFLAVAFPLYLTSSALAIKPVHVGDRGCDDHRRNRCRQMPEGGSALVYLLGAGITSAGAMLIRSRENRSKA